MTPRAGADAHRPDAGADAPLGVILGLKGRGTSTRCIPLDAPRT